MSGNLVCDCMDRNNRYRSKLHEEPFDCKKKKKKTAHSSLVITPRIVKLVLPNMLLIFFGIIFDDLTTNDSGVDCHIIGNHLWIWKLDKWECRALGGEICTLKYVADFVMCSDIRLLEKAVETIALRNEGNCKNIAERWGDSAKRTDLMTKVILLFIKRDWVLKVPLYSSSVVYTRRDKPVIGQWNYSTRKTKAYEACYSG